MSAASFDVSGADRGPTPGEYRDEDFPGCESFHTRQPVPGGIAVSSYNGERALPAING